MRALIGTTLLAEADQDELVRIEGNWYFPPSSLVESMFTPSDTAYHCPWKGDAQYWDVGHGDDVLTDGAWSYPHPIESSFERVGQDYSGYVAFDHRITFEDAETA